MKAMVIGGDSKLGHVLVFRLLETGHEVVWTTRRGPVSKSAHPKEAVVHLDMLEPVLPEFPPELDYGLDTRVVYIMAAITGVVPGESHPDAWRVNAEAPVALALEAHRRGWRVVFMSSGTVEMAQHTASAYQKVYVEGIIHMIGGCVVRPLPTVPSEKYEELADLHINCGPRRTGVVRWGADYVTTA